jgi:hypothetical protein
LKSFEAGDCFLLRFIKIFVSLIDGVEAVKELLGSLLGSCNINASMTRSVDVNDILID